MLDPFITQPDLLQVTMARADQVQTWVNREHVKIEQPNPGRGKSRLYCELDAVKIGVMVRLAAFGIPVTRAAKFADYVEGRYRAGQPLDWDEYSHISFQSQMRQSGHFIASVAAPYMDLGLSEGNAADLRVSKFSEQTRATLTNGKAIDNRQREKLAAIGIHAEPFLFFPLGEVANGIRQQVAQLREDQ